MSEPQTIARDCSQCGAATQAFVVKLKAFGVRNASHGGKQEPRRATLGGQLCESCSDKEEGHRKMEEVRERFEANLAIAHIPKKLRAYTFDGVNQAEARALGEEWAQGKIEGLCLTGKVGVGKSGLAAAAALTMLTRRAVRWVDTAQLVSSLRASFSDSHRAEAMRVIAGDGPAVFDDLDKVTPTEFVQQALFAALNARIAAGSPLIVTTNLPLPQLGDKLGIPILSRLDGHCRTVEMVGPDRRVEG